MLIENNEVGEELDFHKVVPDAVRVINKIEQEYQLIKGLILTESDLKCHLYYRLMQKMRYKSPYPTQENMIYANSVHSELPWYDDQNKLTIKPDITILEPGALSIVRGVGGRLKLPSKQFEFSGKALIFELKFIRGKKGITKRVFDERILPDLMKIQRLFQRIDSQGVFGHVFCIFVIFNKTNKVCDEFSEFIKEYGEGDDYKVVYGTGNVDMDNIENNFSEFPDIRTLNKLGINIPFSSASRVQNRFL
ncbi:hypothetical protein WGM54_08890 [Paenibacillus polymyxa]|uniref:hypothetical protein n=1 Tax=Paenibacillus polymyxa TaxID=1406 RepID=UPI00307D3DC6